MEKQAEKNKNFSSYCCYFFAQKKNIDDDVVMMKTAKCRMITTQENKEIFIEMIVKLLKKQHKWLWKREIVILGEKLQFSFLLTWHHTQSTRITRRKEKKNKEVRSVEEENEIIEFLSTKALYMYVYTFLIPKIKV